MELGYEVLMDWGYKLKMLRDLKWIRWDFGQVVVWRGCDLLAGVQYPPVELMWRNWGLRRTQKGGHHPGARIGVTFVG